MEQKKYSIEEIAKWLKKQTLIDSQMHKNGDEVMLFYVSTDDLTPEAIEKANRINDENQIKLNIK